MVTTDTRDLVNRPLPVVIRQMAVPMALGMLYSTMFNIVDMFFAGQLGTFAQAGIALGYQAFGVLMAFGMGLSAAMGALVGHAVGAKDEAEARQVAAQGISYGIMISLVLIVTGSLVAPGLIYLTSDPGAYRDAAVSYFFILLISLPCFIVAYGCNGILQAQGNSKPLQYSMMFAAIANVGLNPLCIYGIPGVWDGMGFTGLATSTVICWIGTTAYMLIQALKSEALRVRVWQDFHPSWHRYLAISHQAIPVASTLVVMFLSTFIAQYALKLFGGHAIAGYGVAIRIEQILFLPMMGLASALLPVCAQCYGAGAYDRLREALLYCVRIGLVVCALSIVVLWSFGAMVIGLFTDDPDVIRVGVAYLLVDSLALPFYMMLFQFGSVFQALKYPMWPFWINVYRRVFGLALLIWIFIGPLGYDEIGIWYAHFAAVATGWMLGLVLLNKVANQTIGGLWVRPAPKPHVDAVT